MSIITSVKEVTDLIREVGNGELYRKMVDLQREIVEREGENIELVRRVRQLQEQLDAVQRLTFRKPFYYAEAEPDDPYCAHCFETKRIPVHVRGPKEMGGGIYYDCPSCNETIFTRPQRALNRSMIDKGVT